MIGGKDLNLHVLYVEVTKRGGYDQVGDNFNIFSFLKVTNFFFPIHNLLIFAPIFSLKRLSQTRNGGKSASSLTSLQQLRAHLML